MEKYQRIDALSRTQLLFGESKMKRINNVKVIIFGIGGVGSWCAESLIRSGVRHLTIVDGDKVCVSNINRQRMATIHSIGMAKVDEMKKYYCLCLLMLRLWLLMKYIVQRPQINFD